MSKKSNKGLVPKLRFPEFRDCGVWVEKTLSQLGELIAGLTYSPNDIREEGLLVLRSSNVKDGNISLDDNVFVRPDIKGANISKSDDILICVRNGSKALIGKNAIIPDNLPMCTHGAFMTVYRSKSPKFVFQLFQTKAYEKQVNADLGATINSINGNQFKKYVFAVPNTNPEQQKIASCLTSLDELITAETNKLDVLKTYKKGLMQNLFPAEDETVPKLRFPEFKDSGEWEEKTIGSISEVITGSTPSKNEKEYWDGKFNWITAQDFNGKYIEKSKIKLSELGKNKSRLIPKNSILVTCIASIGLNGINKIECATNQQINSMVCKPEFYFEFIYYVISKSCNRLKNLAGQTAVPIINKTAFESFAITISKIRQEQQKIAEFLSSLDDLITAQSQKIETLKTHKKGLMQQLFPSTYEVDE